MIMAPAAFNSPPTGAMHNMRVCFLIRLLTSKFYSSSVLILRLVATGILGYCQRLYRTVQNLVLRVHWNHISSHTPSPSIYKNVLDEEPERIRTCFSSSATSTLQHAPAADAKQSQEHELQVVVTTPNIEHTGASLVEEETAKDKATRVRAPTRNQSIRFEETAQFLAPLNSLEFFPIAPSDIQRYDRGIKIARNSSKLKFPPGTKNYTDRGPGLKLPDGWVSYTHPEGALYFYHEEKCVFTEENIYENASVSERLLNAATTLFSRAEKDGISVAGCELALEITQRKDGQHMGYYFVEHSRRIVFWLDVFRGEKIFERVRGVKTLSQSKYAIESQYWLHVELFPNDRILPQFVLNELRETIVHAAAETLTSNTSTAPFAAEELREMLHIVETLQLGAGGRNAHSLCVSARLLHTFARSKFFNFCGQIGARLDNDQPMYKSSDPQKITALFTIFSYVLFRAPDLHLRALQKVWLDHRITQVSWRMFIGNLNSEWMELTLYSTVIMNANVAFLAIPGVSDTETATAGQIISYASTVASIGAVVIGLLLVRQNRTKGRDDANEALSFMTRLVGSAFGKESLAIMYSLPYALLMWGMLFFVGALACLVFQATDIVTRCLIGFISAVVGFFVFWCVFTSWDENSAVRSAIGAISVKIRSAWHNRQKNKKDSRQNGSNTSDSSSVMTQSSDASGHV
ncbi:hypothetical protein BDQ12DRAFT_692200 [Crucibulum laeve]|uniref:WW domain-containing protein n=1 Tax=Crucibulum laeve TaxID=68775 RepID=A0A5C3LHV8_9AGAR|nr:hypothetical protein BDQ12DRAFT_692200 [Crucibulum laeve]